MKHPHICFTLTFLILFGIEVLIALFVHDAWIRPYFGDILVVCVLYAFLRAILPVRVWNQLHQHRCSWWIALMFVFAVLVEFLQGIQIVERLGWGESAAARTIVGTSFDWADVLCYFSGCLVLCAMEWIEKRWMDKCVK